MKTAVYPGTFDPITNGHIDVIKKSLKIFDKLIIATTDNTDKNYSFSVNERLDIINNSLFKDLKLKVSVIQYHKYCISCIPSYINYQLLINYSRTEKKTTNLFPAGNS